VTIYSYYNLITSIIFNSVIFRYLNFKTFLMSELAQAMAWYGLVSSGSGRGPGAGSCVHGNEPSGLFGISYLSERLLARQVRLGSMESVS
jgi:hypothetical protein